MKKTIFKTGIILMFTMVSAVASADLSGFWQGPTLEWPMSTSGLMGLKVTILLSGQAYVSPCSIYTPDQMLWNHSARRTHCGEAWGPFPYDPNYQVIDGGGANLAVMASTDPNQIVVKYKGQIKAFVRSTEN